MKKENIVGTGHIDYTLLKASIFQEDTLFKTLNSEIIIISLLYTLFKSQDSKIHTLFCGTDPLRQNRGITPPPPSAHTHTSWNSVTVSEII